MRAYYIIIGTILIVVVGMLLFPPLHRMVGFVDTTGFLPVTNAVTQGIPYGFLFMIGYAVWKLTKKA